MTEQLTARQRFFYWRHHHNEAFGAIIIVSLIIIGTVAVVIPIWMHNDSAYQIFRNNISELSCEEMKFFIQYADFNWKKTVLVIYVEKCA